MNASEAMAPGQRYEYNGPHSEHKKQLARLQVQIDERKELLAAQALRRGFKPGDLEFRQELSLMNNRLVCKIWMVKAGEAQ